MIHTGTIQILFEEELITLLKAYNATLTSEISSDGEHYILFHANAQYDEDGNTTHEFTEFAL
tara:strand:- start:1311 stop:1496 length:186 start_codon:yes stop_codon:yes gene_type:complete